MVKKTYKITDMHCTSCALLIEAELEDIGAKSACSYAKGEVEVEFDPQKITEEAILASIKKAGYTATS